MLTANSSFGKKKFQVSISFKVSKINYLKKIIQFNQLKPIEFLLSNTSNVEETIVLGMISQLKEVKFLTQ